MDYEKLSAEPDADIDQENEVSFSVAEMVVKMIVNGALPGQDGKVRNDPDAAIDGVLMGLALVLEQAPEAKTPRALRQQTEDFAKRLLHHAKVFRASFEHSGVHPIAHIDKKFGKATPPSVN